MCTMSYVLFSTLHTCNNIIGNNNIIIMPMDEVDVSNYEFFYEIIMYRDPN